MTTGQRKEWTEWIRFLEMISAKRSWSYLDELMVVPDGYNSSELQDLARACLEVRYASLVKYALNSNDADFQYLPAAWEEYRSREGILSTLQLSSIGDEITYSTLDISLLTPLLKQYLGITIVDKLSYLANWFEMSFVSSPHPIWRWFWALKLLFMGDPQQVTALSPPPLDEKEVLKVKEFCQAFKTKRSELANRFLEIIENEKKNPPSIWECVLHPNAIRNYYPWLHYIEHCFEYRLMCEEWKLLALLLSREKTDALLLWVGDQESILPNGIQLPEMPSLV